MLACTQVVWDKYEEPVAGENGQAGLEGADLCICQRLCMLARCKMVMAAVHMP